MAVSNDRDILSVKMTCDVTVSCDVKVVACRPAGQACDGYMRCDTEPTA